MPQIHALWFQFPALLTRREILAWCRWFHSLLCTLGLNLLLVSCKLVSVTVDVSTFLHMETPSDLVTTLSLFSTLFQSGECPYAASDSKCSLHTLNVAWLEPCTMFSACLHLGSRRSSLWFRPYGWPCLPPLQHAWKTLYPALGTNVASSCGYIGPQYEAYVEIQYKDTTPKPLPKWP